MADRKAEKLNYKTIVNLPLGTGYTPQSLAFVNESKRYVMCSGASPNIVLLCKTNSYSSLGKKISAGHANGATYCNKNDLIYVTGYNNGNNMHLIKAFRKSDFKVAFTITLKSSATGIAYDRITNQFYVSSGSKVYTYPYSSLAQAGSNIPYISSFTKQWTNDSRSNQDIGGHNGVALVCRSFENSVKGRNQTSYIDCYDASNGRYLKSYYSTYGELESVAVDNEGYMHIVFAQDSKIVKTTNKFDLKGSGSTGAIQPDTVNTEVQYANPSLQVSANKLYRSDNYEYFEQKEKDNSVTNAIVETVSKALNSASNFDYGGVPDNSQIVFTLATNTSTGLDKTKRKQTKIEGEVFGPSMPVALDPVEAPFAEITVGGFAFGIYEGDGRHDQYPNYIDSISIKKTNGSMNEYTINLIHQIRPGGNPNFIDELLSKNGYNKIIIRYGDANSGVEFVDSNALLVSVNISFDFVNCNIRYTLKATSSAVAIASHKRTFASKEDKPSNIIRDLLYNDANEDLLTAFPRMRDQNFVENNNLIPTNDVVIAVDEFKNINAVSYLSSLVSIMKSTVDNIVNSNYMLTINDGYFKINEISNNYSYDASLYEVNINFPDDNQVFDFSVDTNYSWPIAYEYSGDVSNYNYDINNIGSAVTYNTNSSHLLDFSSPAQNSLNNNWWKQVTEFPISAKLTCRGLLSPLLLLTYIKINCIYFGGDRIISGVYIVTAQEDSLSGSGYKTTLSLLRVSGSKQHLIVDGRVKT